MLVARLHGTSAWHAVRVLVPVCALAMEGIPAAIGALALQEGGLWLAPRLAATCQRTTAARIFVTAFVVRAIVIFPVHYVNKLANGNGALFQDDYTNDLVGEWMVRIAHGGGISIFRGHQYLLESIYPYLIMAIYTVLGFTPLVPKLLSGALGALTAVLIFDLAQRLFSRRVGLIAATGAAFVPTLIVFSSVTLKEPLVLFAAVLGLWTLQRISHAGPKHLADALLLMLAIIAVALDLRSTLSLILVGLVALVLVVRSRYRPRPWQLGLMALGFVILVGGGLWLVRSRITDRPLAGVVEDVVLQIRHRRAQEAASARSQIRPELEVVTANGSQLPEAEAASDQTPFSVTSDIVEPLAFSLLAPAPWQARSLLELATSAEMLVVWYPLLAACLFARPAESDKRLLMACLVIYAVANWLVLAASEGNVGNLVRHRLMLVPVLLILGSAGLEALWLRAGQPWPRWLPGPPETSDPPRRVELVPLGARAEAFEP